MLPNFLLVGAPKSGTTSLYHILNDHPEIFMSKMKEPKFFVRGMMTNLENPLPKWIDNLEDYQQLFEGSEDKKFRGEASAFYLNFHEEAIGRIKKELGDPHIIIILRNPIHRAISSYKHMRRSNPLEQLEFAEAVREESRTINHPLMMYRQLGLYHEAVAAYKSNFERVLVLRYEDFFSDVPQNVKLVWDFLGVDPQVQLQNQYRFNEKNYEWNTAAMKFYVQKSPLKSALKKVLPKKLIGNLKEVYRKNFTRESSFQADQTTLEYLATYYSEDIANLSELLQRDFSKWLDIGK